MKTLEKTKVCVEDELYIARCLQLARNGLGATSPNPMVGAVIVCDGKIIGEGYHIRCGEAHAEVNAIRSVRDKSLLAKSTIYVSLEPCSHFGKTPPCADLIVNTGIPRVVVAVVDDNAMVCGQGIERMRVAGIDVKVGTLAEESLQLNRNFFVFHREQRPYITLKWAQSADGYIDVCRKSGKAQLISNICSTMAVHKLRSMHDAVLVGTRTALLDNPSLTLRHWSGHSPLRLVIDRYNSLPVDLNLFDKSATTVVYTECSDDKRFGDFLQVQLDFTADIPRQILKHLYDLKINSLLVEGGCETLQGFIDSDLWDEIRVEINPNLFLNDGVSAPRLPRGGKIAQSYCFGNIIKTITR